MDDGNADSGAMKGLGKPCAGKRHARFDERGLETEHGLGTAAPATRTRGQRRTYRPPRQTPTLPRLGNVARQAIMIAWAGWRMRHPGSPLMSGLQPNNTN